LIAPSSLLVRVAADAVQVGGLAVEGADEAGLGGEQQEQGGDDEPGHPDEERPTLNLRVTPHAQPDIGRGEHDHDEGGDEDPILARQPGDGAVRAEDPQHRVDDRDDGDVRVDRNPVPEDEPPSRGGEHEADGTAQDAGLPDVVTARSRHDRHPGGIDEHLERDERDAEHDRPEDRHVLDEGREGEHP
jgi:hypothetical protein